MLDAMMGQMTSEERGKLMGAMMDKFMASVTADEKERLMRSMMGAMGDKEPAGKMPGMMAAMMGSGSRMARMMSMMMDSKNTPDGCGDEKSEEPWDMCRRMMGVVGRANDLASYATPELRQIFEEWLGQIEGEILAAIEESGESDVDSLVRRFKLSAESVQFVLFRLARQGKIDLSAGTARAH
jgi:hypothetical protein